MYSRRAFQETAEGSHALSLLGLDGGECLAVRWLLICRQRLSGILLGEAALAQALSDAGEFLLLIPLPPAFIGHVLRDKAIGKNRLISGALSTVAINADLPPKSQLVCDTFKGELTVTVTRPW